MIYARAAGCFDSVGTMTVGVWADIDEVLVLYFAGTFVFLAGLVHLFSIINGQLYIVLNAY